MYLKTEGCCVLAGHIDLRKDKQLLETVVLTDEEMTTHSHMQNKEEDTTKCRKMST